MNLTHALRLGPTPKVALVGAGGKTTLMFQLARELLREFNSKYQKVIVSATTHLADNQLVLADHHFIISSISDIASVDKHALQGVVLFTGSQDDSGRTIGLPQTLLEAVLELANRWDCPLLVEADGSRQRPLKAPADHEPVIPSWVDIVLVLAGLSAIGKPLKSEWVHRPVRFGDLANLMAGELVSAEALMRVLSHPAGGLKGVPAGARRVLVLNQADTPELQALAYRLSKKLLDVYQSAVITSLRPPDVSNEEDQPDTLYESTIAKKLFPTVNTIPGHNPHIYAVHEPTAGIILAAGGSTRFGKPKQILSWHGTPLVRYIAQVGLSAGLSEIVVVTGSSVEEVNIALEGLPVTMVHNMGWRDGLSSSVVAGLRSLSGSYGAVIFLLADQPHVSPHLIHSLIELHSQTLSPLVSPLVQGQRANPVLFDQRTFPDLFSLTGDVGGRSLFSRYPVAWLPWHDQLSMVDVDTQDDYERLQSLT